MGICADELRVFVIRPTLEQLGSWSTAAENLLLGTAAQESGLGFHLKTKRGRGLGIFQITPQTHINVWDKYLITIPNVASDIRGLASQHEFLAHPHAELATNLSYATAIAWMIYQRHQKALPAADDIEALGRYWRRYFHHRATDNVEAFVNSYQKYVLGVTDEIAA